jgi:hypothetical protein
MKYQCNSCGKVHDYRSDAVNCHPDINEIPDEQLESRLAAQQSAHLTGLQSPPKCTTEKLCPVHNVWHASPPRR